MVFFYLICFAFLNERGPEIWSTEARFYSWTHLFLTTLSPVFQAEKKDVSNKGSFPTPNSVFTLLVLPFSFILIKEFSSQ